MTISNESNKINHESFNNDLNYIQMILHLTEIEEKFDNLYKKLF